MKINRPSLSGRSEDELDESMRALAVTIREAGECLLDLEQAVQALRMANDPAFARAVDTEAAHCLHSAMRR